MGKPKLYSCVPQDAPLPPLPSRCIFCSREPAYLLNKNADEDFARRAHVEVGSRFLLGVCDEHFVAGPDAIERFLVESEHGGRN